MLYNRPAIYTALLLRISQPSELTLHVFLTPSNHLEQGLPLSLLPFTSHSYTHSVTYFSPQPAQVQTTSDPFDPLYHSYFLLSPQTLSLHIINFASLLLPNIRSTCHQLTTTLLYNSSFTPNLTLSLHICSTFSSLIPYSIDTLFP